MNEEKNNLNMQQNKTTLTSWKSGPAQTIKNQIMADSPHSVLSNVGSATTYQASNKVISWGVGQKNSPDSSTQEEIDVLFDEDMLNQVNGVVSDNTEVLDETFIENPSAQPRFKPIEQPKPKINPQPFNATTNPVYTPPDASSNIMQNDANWANNQPLSGGKLGLNTIDSSAQAKDVQEKGKFFGSNLFGKKQKPAFTPPTQPMPAKKDLGLDEPLPEVNEIDLLSNYIRHEYNKINMSVFSFQALIFKGAYFINKKIYFLGLIIYFIEFYILTNLSLTYSLVSYAILSLVVAFIANPLYLAYAKTKTKLIRKAKKNRKKNQYELNQLCYKAGGTNFLLAFIIFVIFYAIIFYISMYELPNAPIKTGYDYITKYIEEKKKPVYDGVIDRLSFDVENTFNITIPEDFKKQQGKIYKYLYSPNGKEEIKTCELTISRINKFHDANDYITQYQKYEKIEKDIVELKRDDTIWYTLEQQKRYFNKKINVATINGNVILLEYNIGLDTEPNKCENYYNEIFESITIKE
ncbi:MAG TPA: hypothetical protein DCE23_01130 [Firmicutes bacterium]|nr:hypothetical protein [Bacillota bacterium]